MNLLLLGLASELKMFTELHIFLWIAKSTHFIPNLEIFSEYAIFGKYPKIISILHRGDFLNLLQYYNRGGGVYRDPKFVLRNKWTAPNVYAARDFVKLRIANQGNVSAECGLSITKESLQMAQVRFFLDNKFSSLS